MKKLLATALLAIAPVVAVQAESAALTKGALDLPPPPLTELRKLQICTGALTEAGKPEEEALKFCRELVANEQEVDRLQAETVAAFEKLRVKHEELRAELGITPAPAESGPMGVWSLMKSCVELGPTGKDGSKEKTIKDCMNLVADVMDLEDAQ